MQSTLIILQSDDISEKQLAEIALAIQNRWEVPAFVKMHEIIVSDDDAEPNPRIRPEDFERGMNVIFENLEMNYAFKIHRSGRSKFTVERLPNSRIPKWMEDIEKPPITPEGVFECPHCGKWFPTDVELSLHQKLHYII